MKRQVFERAAVVAAVTVLVLARGASPASAANDGTPLEPNPPLSEEVVVSANLTATESDKVGTSVTVVGRDEIEARHASSVIELLRGLPGVAAVQNGGPGRAASAFLRGANSSHTLVLVDGTRVNSLTSGAYDFADLVPEQVERIEIVRGPQSSLYGSEAIGGVINVVTRRGAAGAPATLSAEVGPYASHRLQGSAAGANDAFDWRVSAANERLPGWSLAARRAGDEAAFPYRNTTAAGLVGAALPGGGRAELSLRWADATVHPDGFGEDPESGAFGPVAAPRFTQRRKEAIGSGKVQWAIGDVWRPSVRIGVNREDLAGSDPDDVYNNFHIGTLATNVTAQVDVRLPHADTLTAGVSYERRKGDEAGSYDETVTVRSVFAQNQWSIADRLYLTAAVRHDRHSVFGGRATYRATAAWLLPSVAGRVHASYGTGFKAPTFVDLYYPYYGNPALRPETSTGYDIGLEKHFANRRVTADVTVFHNTFRDLINFDLNTFLAANIDRARARGVESSVSITLSKSVQLGASYTWTDSENAATGKPLPRRPVHQGSLSARWQASQRVGLGLGWFVARGRIEADGATLDDVARLDASVDVAVAHAAKLFVRAQNLTGATYEEVRGYRSPGRFATLGMAVSF